MYLLWVTQYLLTYYRLAVHHVSLQKSMLDAWWMRGGSGRQSVVQMKACMSTASRGGTFSPKPFMRAQRSLCFHQDYSPMETQGFAPEALSCWACKVTTCCLSPYPQITWYGIQLCCAMSFYVMFCWHFMACQVFNVVLCYVILFLVISSLPFNFVVSFHFLSFHFIFCHFMMCQFISCCFISCHVSLRHIISSHHFISCCVMLCDFGSCHFLLTHAILFCVMSRDFVSCHNMTCDHCLF